MKKLVFLVVIFLVIGGFGFSESMLSFSGEEWILLTEDEQIIMVAGVTMASGFNYAAVTILNELEVIDDQISEILKDLNNFDVQLYYIVDQINNWYNETGKWDEFVYIVILTVTDNMERFSTFLQNSKNIEDQL